MNAQAASRRSFSPTLILLSVAVFLLALLPRWGAIEHYVTPDELRWVDRSLRFAQALTQGDLASTIQSGHPGITTLWLGSFGSRLQQALPATLPDFDPQNAEGARWLAQFLDAARRPVIIVVALNIVVLFLLLDRLIARRAAFLVAGLLALDPFAVALGSLLHVDALMTAFSVNSLAALGVTLYHPRPTRWLILSGIFAGLAMLSKSPGAILSVAVFSVLCVASWREAAGPRRSFLLRLVKRLALWGIAAGATFILLTPAMWVQPLGTLQLMRTTAENFSETAHAVNFFNGSNARDPGPLFYPVALAFRSTPLLWLGLASSLLLIARAHSERDQRMRSLVAIFGIFALLFLSVITLGAKKLDRYVLPALEALGVVGALGLAFVIEKIGARISAAQKRQWFLNVAVAACLLIPLFQFTPVWPLTLRAYNPLLGGYTGASHSLPVGGGESAEVGRALSASPYADQVIAVSDVVGTAPYFSGMLRANTAAGLAQAAAMLFTAADFQLTPDVVQKWVATTTPVMTITVQGQPYAWLYPNQWLAGDQQRLTQNYQAGDWLLTDSVAQIPVPLTATQVLTTDVGEGEAMALLQQIAPTHDRVWVIHYAASPRSRLSPLFRVLDTYAIQLDEWSTPLSEGALYALPEQLSFTTQPTPLQSNVTFGDHLHLNHAELLVPHLQPGQAIGVVGEWTASGPEAQAQVALMDEAGHQWSTGDALVPLSADARVRRINVRVPLTIPPGEYQLVLNVIDVQNGSPLALHRADGQFGGIDWPLGAITIDPARTPIDAATRRPPITLNAPLGEIIAIGSETPPDPIITGDPWTLAMEWTATTDRLPVLDVQWVWAQDDRVVYSTTLPLNPYATDQWRNGEVVQSKYDFRLPINVPAGVYSLRFKVIERATGRPLVERAMPLATVTVASRPRTFTPPKVARPLDVQFADVARLVGADVIQSGTQLTLTLFWQAQAVTTTNYTAFVQLLDATGASTQQIDRWQLAFDAPTSTWVPEQVIADRYTFELPTRTETSGTDAPAVSRFGIGLYNAATGQRLPALQNGQRTPEDRVIIP